MCSIRRLARMLASLDVARAPPAPDRKPKSEDRDRVAPVRAPRLIVQKGGLDRGRIARLDSLGLVVRVKRPVDGSRFG